MKTTAWDREVAGEIGLRPEDVARARSELGVKMDAEGRSKVSEHLFGSGRGQNVNESAGRGPEGGVVEAAAAGFELLVILHKRPNPTFVRVRTPEGEPYDLRVRSSIRLRPGMKLQCVRDGDGWKCVHAGFQAVR